MRRKKVILHPGPASFPALASDDRQRVSSLAARTVQSAFVLRKTPWMGGKEVSPVLLEANMEQASEHPFPGLKDHYRLAAEQGFPAFIGDIRESNPINATPYVVSLGEFLSEPLPPAKRVLRDALSSALGMLPNLGLQAEIILVGGSFLRRDSEPRDLDCVIFYSRSGDMTGDAVTWRAQQKSHGLDLRLIPIEMDPVMVLKSALFFGALYGINRDRSQELNGLVLVDCSK